MTKKDIVKDIVLRKLKFHYKENWEFKGLFSWKEAFPYLVNNPTAKEKLLETDYKEENKTIWAKPTKEFLENEIKPLLKSIAYKNLKHQIEFIEYKF